MQQRLFTLVFSSYSYADDFAPPSYRTDSLWTMQEWSRESSLDLLSQPSPGHLRSSDSDGFVYPTGAGLSASPTLAITGFASNPSYQFTVPNFIFDDAGGTLTPPDGEKLLRIQLTAFPGVVLDPSFIENNMTVTWNDGGSPVPYSFMGSGVGTNNQAYFDWRYNGIPGEPETISFTLVNGLVPSEPLQQVVIDTVIVLNSTTSVPEPGTYFLCSALLVALQPRARGYRITSR